MTVNQQDYPLKWLLEIHAQAIEHGIVLLHPVTEDAAKSIKMRMLRLRRRTDKGAGYYVPPEYHLVTIGQWRTDRGGCLPIIYDKLPDDHQLPSISPISGEEFCELTAVEPVLALPTADPILHDISEADLRLNPEEIGSFVERMKKRVQQ
jgi:hypothetical protein